MVVQFTNTSTDATSYLWTFAGSVTTTQTNPSVNFTTPGTYTVTLQATNANGTDTETKTNYITVGSGNTNVAFTYTVSGNTVNFVNQSSGASSYVWNFGDGNTSSQTNPTHTYAANGAYTVTLTGVGACGNETSTQVVVIQSSGPPNANFTADQTSGCTPFTVNFQSTSTGSPTNYQWSFPGSVEGASSMPNPEITYDSPGVYDVILTVFNAFGSDTHTMQNYISVTEGATVGFTTTQSGNTVTFDNTSEGTSSYLWNFGDGNTSTQANPVHTYASFGTYTVTLTGFSSCGNSSVTSVVTINNTPPPNAAFTVLESQGCAPHTTQFLNQSTGSVSSIQWLFPGGTPSVATWNNPTVTYPNPGVYTVTLTVTNGGGSDTETKTDYITVWGPPELDYDYVQSGNTVTIDNNTQGDYTYLWDFGDGYTTVSPSPYHTYTQGGTYTITVTATDACGTDTDSFEVTIADPPTAAFTANETESCGAFTVSYTNQSTGSGNTYLWTFPGGIPATSTQVNPTVTYLSVGTRNVTLTATNASGSDTETKFDYISILQNPIADFTSSVDGNTVDFTFTGSAADSYAWNFGDGNTSTQVNPTHTYTANGTYVVTLTASNECGDAVKTQNVVIFVETAPTADFTANDTEGCAPFTVTFNNASSANATSFAWTFAGGTPATSTAANPTVTFANAGTYNVTLTATNSAGSDTETKNNFISVGTTPTADFNTTVSGFNAVFTNTSANATSYTWNFGDGNTSSQANPTHSYAANGTYNVTLTSTNECGSVTTGETVTIFVESVPTADFTANDTEGCAPFTVTFNNASSANATSFAWTFAGGTPATSTAANPTVTFANAGTYNVTLTATNSAGSDTETKNNFISVGTTPTADFNTTVSGFNAVFTNTSANATSYTWNFGDGNTSSQANPTHSYAANGTYNVTLTSTNECGSVTTGETVTIFVESAPTADFTANDTEGCAPFSVTFSNGSSANAASFAWTFEGGTPATSTAANPTVTFANAGIYNVTLTATNSAGSDTETKSNYITVGTAPTADFNTTVNGNTVAFTNISAGATGYAWNFGDGNTSNDTNPTHSYAANGTYSVTLTASNECGTATDTETVTIFVESVPAAGFTADATEGCAPFTVTFNNTSSSNADGFAWTFEGGNPATSTDANPTVTFANAGTYNVTLTASNEAGENTVTQEDFIMVNAAPTAGFSAAVDGMTAVFSNTSDNATDYTWNFGDGQTGTDANPTHTYAANGTYSVTLTATNECGDAIATETVTIFVETAPTAAFTTAETNGCIPFAVQMQNQSSANATDYLWTAEGAQIASSTDENPTFVYDTPGVYSITLTVSNSAGTDTETKTDYITVGQTPTASFTYNQIDNGLYVESTSTGAETLTWDFGDGTVIVDQENPVNLYAEDGTYTVTLTAENACGTDVQTLTITVYTVGPNADFTADATEGCAPFTVNFENLSTNSPTNYYWIFEGANIENSFLTNPSVTYSEAGEYNVILVAFNSNGIDSVEYTNYITVHEEATADFSVESNGQYVQFTNLSDNYDSLLWTFGDGNTSTEENPLHLFTEPGDYEVVLEVTNFCGTVFHKIMLTVEALEPTAVFTADITEGCADLIVQFADESLGEPTAWLWTFEGGNPATSTEQNPFVTFENAGTYTVSLEVSNASGSTTTTFVDYIAVNDAPIAEFTYEASAMTVDFTVEEMSNTSYYWDFGDGNTATLANPTHEYTEPGAYTVTLVAENECGGSFYEAIINVTVSSTEVMDFLNEFEVYPNPNFGQFTLRMEGDAYASRDLTVRFTDIVGQVIEQESIRFDGSLQRSYDYRDLPAGIYILSVEAGQQRMFKKVVVE